MSVNHGANLYNLSSKYGFSKEEFMDFSSNINPFGTSKLAKEYVINNINMVSMYPDPDYINLKKSVSSYCKCLDENIILGSGATELISSFIETINPKKALLISPAYSEYEKELSKINCKVEKYFAKCENDFKIDTKELILELNKNDYDLIIICNPNNPTGFTFSKYEVKEILESTKSFVMIDETYIEFTDTNTYSSTQLVDTHPNLFVIRGTSKFFSTPGIRLGYGLICNEEIKNNINSNLDLWNINILASSMGEIMFTDEDFISNTVDIMLRERDYLVKELSNIKDLKVYESQGNFILCKIKSEDLTGKELREKLIPNKIIIRDCASFDGLNEFFFRVCILKPKENKLLISELKKIFN
ncbi:aminotransferase class I/II-fold pyridoxal phosphate-dependent enzyme [Romboutsia maritimum]|uniref:Aminotransferase class I/II-fold pyridoxal phosphate-dependent enzyme n=1 Tax=Romboutsia maritimum TaxID=2020948 RepID=A0A371IWX8_9FIRM|nr:aminotransferase class I/II-fold pyridoxal phosphate-dependent enzyme [Romboutsia maritimum]RDY24978.1 aminotransferase class I/II-fold pyridoxal phosphate-dependent enzyme [Romboutsia maritimum]